jgi:hypothetical protein
VERNKTKERTAGYIFAIIFNLIILYIVNNLLNWQIYFITPAFNEVLWIINLSIVTTIIGNTLLLLYSPVVFRHLIKIIMNTINFIAVYFVYQVFPFNFYNSFFNWGLSIFLVLVMIGLIIASFVEVYQLANKN